MHFIKLQTSDQDTRWINLQQVSRVTTGTEAADVPFVAILFGDATTGESLKIRGDDEINRHAIEKLIAALDVLAGEIESVGVTK